MSAADADTDTDNESPLAGSLLLAVGSIAFLVITAFEGYGGREIAPELYLLCALVIICGTALRAVEVWAGTPTTGLVGEYRSEE